MAEVTISDPARDRLLHGPLALTVLRFGAPLAAAMVLQVVFNLVDQYIIARLPPALSDASLDALGICDMVAALGTILSYGVSSATATLVAQARGRGDRREVAEIAWGSVGLVTLLGLAFGVVAILGSDVIVHHLLGAKGLVRELAGAYLRVIVGGIVTVFLMFQVTAVQRAMGQSKLPLAVFAAGNVLNLFLAVLLVYGDGPAPTIFAWGPPIAHALGLPRWGVVGAAWATVIARAVVMVPPLWLLHRTLRVSELGTRLLPSRPVLRRIVALAWPTSTQFSVRIAAVLLVIALVHHFFTTPGNSDAGTAYALCLRMETMALFVSMGWGGAAQTLVGTNIGAGLFERARRAAWITGAYNVLTMLGLAALFIGQGERFLRFFTTQDVIVRRAQDYLAMVGPSYAAFGFAIVLGNALVGAGSTRLALRVDLVLVLLVQFPLMLVVTAALRLPPSGLWAAVVAVNIVSAVVYTLVARKESSWHSSTA